MKVGILEYRPGHWQVYFTFEGKQVHLTKWLGKSLISKSMAIALKSHIEKSGYDPAHFDKDKAFTFQAAMETWFKLSTCSEEWLQQRKQIAKRCLIPYFGKNTDIRKIKTIHIQEFHAYLKSKKLKDKTIKNYMGELKGFFRFHRKSLPDIPDFPTIAFQEPDIKTLTAEEQDMVFKFIPERDLPIFTFMRQYGCRENEASGLLKQNVFLDHDPPYFVIATVLGAARGQIKYTTKTRRIKVLPILSEIRWVFNSNENTEFVFSKDGKPYTNRRLVRIWNIANKASGVQPCNLNNAMRHSFITQRVNDGIPIDGVGKVAGHTTIKTTQRYLKYNLKTLEDIIRGKVVNRVLIASRPLELPEKPLNPNSLGKDGGSGLKDSNLG